MMMLVMMMMMLLLGGGWWWWWWYKVIEPLYNMEKHGHLHDSGDTIWQSIQSPVWVDDFPLQERLGSQPCLITMPLTCNLAIQIINTALKVGPR